MLIDLDMPVMYGVRMMWGVGERRADIEMRKETRRESEARGRHAMMPGGGSYEPLFKGRGRALSGNATCNR